MSRDAMPKAVLADQLQVQIGGRPVRAAVFTTYNLDPDFFELHVLSSLFDRSFSQVDKLRRIQLEDALAGVENIAVYYDRSALSQDALPARLDVRRIDVRRKTGVFHPKAVLVLVENPDAAPELDPGPGNRPLSLIVGTLSANLTRAGWWENVEAGHFEEISDVEIDAERCSFRKDLFSLLRRIRDAAPSDEQQDALDAIHRFVKGRTNRDPMLQVSSGGVHHTRLYCGQSSLPDFLAQLRLERFDWNLEVISPYFDAGGAATLERLQAVVTPKDTRVYLPVRLDGEAEITEELYDAISEVATWSKLPAELLKPATKGTTDKAAPRWVHAKAYRLWEAGGRDISIVGSVNLTAPAHSHGAAGNLEAAFLVDRSGEGTPRRWWLTPIDDDPAAFASNLRDEAEASSEVPIDLSLRFAWDTGKLEYYLDADGPAEVTLHEPAGRRLFALSPARANRWIDCGEEVSRLVADVLCSTSFLLVRHDRGEWRVLVREEGMAQKPSLVRELTPEEILLYWSLLTPEQREAFIEDKLSAGATLEGLPVSVRQHFVTEGGVFEHFAGIYHAFEQLWRFVDEAIEQGREREALARLLGAKYDSLPVLLQRSVAQQDRDPVITYVTFLCAEQIRRRVAKRHPEFWKAHRTFRPPFEEMLAKLSELRDELELEGDAAAGGAEFLDWYESVFLRELEQPEVQA